jgi:hypothetical protein
MFGVILPILAPFVLKNLDLRLKQHNISNIGKPFKSKFKLQLNIAQTGVSSMRYTNFCLNITPRQWCLARPSVLKFNNIKLINIPMAVGVIGSEVILSSRTLTIDSWGQGNIYSGITGQKTFTQGNIPAAAKATSLLSCIGNIVSKGHPQYKSYAVTRFVSARDHGCTGDGHTDNTVAINSLLTKVHTCRTL